MKHSVMTDLSLFIASLGSVGVKRDNHGRFKYRKKRILQKYLEVI